jgi:predicted peptidase
MLSTLAACLSIASPQAAPALPPDGLAWKVRGTVSVEMRFIVALPEGYDGDSKQKWPVVLFLHGAGERGTDLNKIRVHGPLKEIAKGRKLPFIFIAPQCPESEVWDPAALDALLDAAEKKYRIDKQREYVTGLSMGGYGTWAMVAAQPSRFAAAAPICGGGGAAWIAASRLATTPIWTTHGDADPAVPIAEDQRIVDAVKRAGGNVRFDIIPGAGHDVWTNVYAGQEIYDWFLSHVRAR